MVSSVLLPIAMFLMFLISLSLGQLVRLPLGASLVNVYLYDVLLLALLVVWGFWFVGNWKKISKLEIPRLCFLVALFALWSLATLIFSYSRFGGTVFAHGFFYWGRWCLYFCLFPIVYTLGRARFFKKSAYWFLSLLIASGVLVAVFGFVQLALFPDFTSMALLGGWDPHHNRLLSTFFDPNFTGAYLAICFLLALPCFFEAGRASSKWWRGVALAIIGLALLLTFSRSAWGLLAVGLLVLGVLKYRWLLLVGILFALGAYFFIPRVQTRLVGITDPADSAAHRLVSWKRTWGVYREYPWWGAGFGNFRLAQKDANYFKVGEWGGRSGAGSDSSLLLILATTGPVGFLLYLMLYGSIAIREFRLFKKAPAKDIGLLGLSLLAVFLGLALESNFINTLFYPQIMAITWIAVGISYF